MSYPSKFLVLAFALATVGTVAHAAVGTTTDPQTSIEASTDGTRAIITQITLADARAIALKAHAGKITDEELEKEDGGSGMRYSFDIKDAKGTQEVGVDAKTGTVLENKLEGPNPD